MHTLSTAYTAATTATTDNAAATELINVTAESTATITLTVSLHINSNSLLSYCVALCCQKRRAIIYHRLCQINKRSMDTGTLIDDMSRYVYMIVNMIHHQVTIPKLRQTS